jgi:hypothetical protein
MPAAQVVFLVLEEDVPDVVRVVEEVDEEGTNAEAEHVAEPPAGVELEPERLAQEPAEGADGEGEPVVEAGGFGHARGL